MSDAYPQLLRPEEIEITALNYSKYEDIENELSTDELIQFIKQLKEKIMSNGGKKVSVFTKILHWLEILYYFIDLNHSIP